MAENRCIHTDCEGFYRRDFLKAGALGLFGLSLTDLFRLKAHAATPRRVKETATSVILVWLGGGPSHLDMWDLKPEAPEEIRGFSNQYPQMSTAYRLVNISRNSHNRPISFVSSVR